MGNKSSKKTISLKEEKDINIKSNNIKNNQENANNTSKPSSLENAIKLKEKKEDEVDDIIEKKMKNDEQISQFENISKIMREKNEINKKSNKQTNKENFNNNINKNSNQVFLISNEFQRDYVIDVNKCKRKKNGKKMKVPKKLKNFISTSKYTWYNFIPKILYEQFSKMSNIYFIIIAILQCFPEISNADGKPIILMPLCVVIFINSVKDFYEDWKRKKSDDEENNREVEVYDLDKKDFVTKKWKNIFVGNILKIKKDGYFPADCVLISSSNRKTHNCFVESKNLDGETNLKIKKSINNFVERCRDLSSFQGKLTTQMPNEYIYQFDAVFEFDSVLDENKGTNDITTSNNTKITQSKLNEVKEEEIDINNKKKLKKSHLRELISDEINNPNNLKEENNEENENNEEVHEDDYLGEDEDANYNEEETDRDYSVHTYYTDRKNKFSNFQKNDNSQKESIIIDSQNFLLRGCSLRQTESVLCFVVYTGKNTKIMQNSPGARSKTSSLEKKMSQQIKYIFFFQILLSLTASLFSLFQIIILKRDPAPYLYINKDECPFNFEEYSKMFYVILSKDNLKRIFSQKDSIFMMVKKFINEIAPLFDLRVIMFFMIKLGTWCVLMNNLVPISLLMTMELVKYFQGWFISWDIDIYDRNKKVMTKVQTSTLNEELGQVRYIFSDKTGTLTKNYMNFKRVTIGYNQYNQLKEDEFESSTSILNYVNNSIKGVNKVENNDKNKSNKKEKKNKESVNTNESGEQFKADENNKIEEINQINNNKNNNGQEIIYNDNYGIITNVLFLDDETFMKDLKLINKDGNNEDILDESNMNNKKIDSSEEEDDEDNISLNNNLDYNINENLSNKKISEKLTQDNFLDLFMTAISTCHSGIINEKEFETSKKIEYQASSPDEIAILNFARKYKYIFFGRKDNNKIIIEKPELLINKKISSKKVIYKIPMQFEYSSERKSMSVMVQNMENPEEIYLFMKGADNVILNKRDKKNKNNQKIIRNIENALDNYAKEGLRILAVAYKKISLNELNIYQKEYLKACKSTYNKKEKLEILAKKIENDLILLGVTGIQDELQDDVYETLRDFSEAGIKLWVLTGDKKDTAKSIAFSCGLFDEENFNIFEIKEGLTKIQLESRLNELAEQFNNIVDKINNKSKLKIDSIKKKSQDNNEINTNEKKISKINNKNDNEEMKTKFALVISSDELNILALNYELEILFYELASRCNSVLCCRVSPIQKAKMVHLIQRFTKMQEHKGANYYKYLQQDVYNNNEEEKNKKIIGPLKDSVTTLAIGDGANDVNMITSAHIGIGIIGVEGKQAARASDYAIGEFRFLKKLLFFHGHESLRKNSFIIFYNFYKNFLFVMPLFFVGFYSLFSGQTIYDPWLYQLYNIAFTVLPIIWFGIYDSERTTTESMNNPKYYYNLNQKMFNIWKFWEWIFYGIIQGFAVFFFIFSSNNIYAHNIEGEIQDFKCSGAMAYSLVIIIANFKVFQVTSVHGFISIFFLIISIASYYGLIYLMNDYYKLFYFGIFWRVIKNYRYYLIISCLSFGLTFIGGGVIYIQKICANFENKVKHNKIMFSFKEHRKKKDKKNKKNKNKKKKKNKSKDNEKTQIIEATKPDSNLIEEEIFENKDYDEKKSKDI